MSSWSWQRISKVKGHADEAMVLNGQVREVDRLGNNAADEAADFGRRRSVMVGGVWNGFLLGRVRNQVLPCRFCGAPDHDGHLFWECTFPPLVEIREHPEFHDIMRMDKRHWPRCLLWHGWLPLLSGTGGGSPWADSAGDAAVYMLESAFGSYSFDIIQSWDFPQGVDWDSAKNPFMRFFGHLWGIIFGREFGRD